MEFKLKEVELYKNFTNAKTNLVLPLLKILNFLKITPSYLTFAGVFLMISFVYFTKTNPLFALVLLVLAFLLDGLDGSLARLQNVATDKGKFIDILADNLNFTLFVMGLTYAELIPGLLAAALIYSMVISRALQIILKGLTMPSDWYFKPWAGAYVNTFVYLSYLLFFLFVVFKIDIFERTLWIFTGLLALKALIDFYLIIKKPSQKKSN